MRRRFGGGKGGGGVVDNLGRQIDVVGTSAARVRSFYDHHKELDVLLTLRAQGRVHVCADVCPACLADYQTGMEFDPVSLNPACLLGSHAIGGESPRDWGP